ncbi:unnamed protein product, partial [Laminaria digitata]
VDGDGHERSANAASAAVYSTPPGPGPRRLPPTAPSASSGFAGVSGIGGGAPGGGGGHASAHSANNPATSRRGVAKKSAGVEMGSGSSNRQGRATALSRSPATSSMSGVDSGGGGSGSGGAMPGRSRASSSSGGGGSSKLRQEVSLEPPSEQGRLPPRVPGPETGGGPGPIPSEAEMEGLAESIRMEAARARGRSGLRASAMAGARVSWGRDVSESEDEVPMGNTRQRGASGDDGRVSRPRGIGQFLVAKDSVEGISTGTPPTSRPSSGRGIAGIRKSWGRGQSAMDSDDGVDYPAMANEEFERRRSSAGRSSMTGIRGGWGLPPQSERQSERDDRGEDDDDDDDDVSSLQQAAI